MRGLSPIDIGCILPGSIEAETAVCLDADALDRFYVLYISKHLYVLYVNSFSGNYSYFSANFKLQPALDIFLYIKLLVRV